jgi:hypothetical protein
MNGTLIARINELEAQMTAEWGVEAPQQIAQEQERRLNAREELLPRPGLLRRWFQFFTDSRKETQC